MNWEAQIPLRDVCVPTLINIFAANSSFDENNSNTNKQKIKKLKKNILDIGIFTTGPWEFFETLVAFLKFCEVL